MLRSVAIQRIADGLGNRTGLTDKIALRLQEAQRDLESGKTLPLFLKQEAQTLSLLAGVHSISLPTGFIREDDEEPPHYTLSSSTDPVFLQRKQYKDALAAYNGQTGAPQVYVLRTSTIDFIRTADQNYTLTWSYFKHASLLTTDIENEWLANAPEWLIGEAGLRMAKDLRDADAVNIFTDLAVKGRAAWFGEHVAREESGGNFTLSEDA